MNAFYDHGRQNFGDGYISWTNDVIKAVLVDASVYTPDLANHSTLADVPVGARVAISDPLTGKTNIAGVFDADDTIFVGVSGATYTYVILFQGTGVDPTSRLILFIDTSENLPGIPTGGNVKMTWPNTASKICKL